jgi:hypothetical protein
MIGGRRGRRKKIPDVRVSVPARVHYHRGVADESIPGDAPWTIESWRPWRRAAIGAR